jgi:outer membrane protein TolC
MLKRSIVLSLIFVLVNVTLKCQDLDYFISKALENNPVLDDYGYQLKQGPVDSLGVKALYKPYVNSSAQAMYAPSSNNFGYDPAITNGGNYTAVVSVSQDLFKGPQKENQFEAIDLKNKGISNNKRITGNDIIRQVSYAYLMAVSDKNELNFSYDFLSLMQEQGNILKVLANQGIYRQSDYMAFLVEMQGQEVNIHKTKLKLKDDLHNLFQLCGISDSTKSDISSPSIIRKMPVDLSSSPLFMQFAIDSLQLENQKITVDNRYRPSLNWFADAGVMSSIPENLYRHFGFSLGLNFSIPIYDGSLRKLDKQKISLQENSRSSYENFFRKKYNDQLRQLDEQLSMNDEMKQSIEKQLSSTKELIGLYREELNQGSISVTEVIIAMKNYVNIEKELNQVKIDRLRIIVDWNYLMQE